MIPPCATCGKTIMGMPIDLRIRLKKSLLGKLYCSRRCFADRPHANPRASRRQKIAAAAKTKTGSADVGHSSMALPQVILSKEHE